MKGLGHAGELGRKAREQGRSVQSNPYKHSGRAWEKAWLWGYRQQKEREGKERA